MSREEFKVLLKGMSVDDLKTYDKSARFISRFFSVLAIGTIFACLMISNILVYGIGAICVVTFAQISVGITETRKLIKERLGVLENR